MFQIKQVKVVQSIKSYRQIDKDAPILFPLFRLHFQFSVIFNNACACYGSYEIRIDTWIIYLSCMYSFESE